MDRVPAVFRNAVSATWTCCPYGVKCACKGPTLRRSGWAFTNSSTRTAFDFYIGTLRGQWVYGFRDAKQMNDELRTLADLKNLPNAEDVRIQSVFVIQADSHKLEAQLKPLDSDFEEMLKSVRSICNGPWLYLKSTVPFFCANGEILLAWIEQTWFSMVFFLEFNFIHGHLERFVEQQNAAWKPTLFLIKEIGSGAIVLEKWLREGPVNWANIRVVNYRCPPDVLKGYLKRFMDHADDFKEVKFEILVPFADDFKKMMREVNRRYGRFCVTKSDCLYVYEIENLYVQVNKYKKENGEFCHIVCAFESS